MFIVAGFAARTCAAEPLVIDLTDEQDLHNVVRGQTRQWPYIIELDERSQSNVVVQVSVDPPQPCPLKYTNVLSNTNLFTPAERELIRAIPAKYEPVTTNSGPPGTVLIGLARAFFNWGDGLEGVLAHFAYTNSAAREEIAFFGSREKVVKYQSKPGCGYYAQLVDNSLCAYQEFRDGKLNGLFTAFYQNNCDMWLRFTNGNALGKFLIWGRRGPGEPPPSGLAVEAEFRQPYDFLKYQQMRFDLTWMDSPTIITNATSPAGTGPPRR
jgi:hypothetical protein